MKNLDKDIYVFIQFLLIIFLGIIATMSIFIKELNFVAEIIIGILLIIIGINNSRIYKRKFFTVIYFIAGIFVLGFSIYEVLINGI